MTVSGRKGKIEKAVELDISLNYVCSWSIDQKLAVADERVGRRQSYFSTRRICLRYVKRKQELKNVVR